MPDDQLRDYIPTQAVADYLATLVRPHLDGILYPSAQIDYMRPSYPRGIFGTGRHAGSRNVVLFHKSAGVQPFGVLEDTDISVAGGPDYIFLGLGGLGDQDVDPEVDYTVFEKIASAASPGGSEDAPLKFSTMEVHHVRGVRFDTVFRPVHRYPTGNPGPNIGAE